MALAAAPGAPAAGEPTMALSAVQPGMVCTARTVVRGTDISTFDMTILDVIGSGTGAQILARASGPVVEETGVAEGFSGSPVSCPAAGGGSAIVGAIAYATGDFGNRLVLLTPIGAMLAEPTSRLPVQGGGLAGPLTVGGVSGPVAAALARAARRAGRSIVIAPGAPAQIRRQAPAPLVPGSSVAAVLAAGTIEAGAVGTVSYVDGDRIWAFGHPFDNAGRRALLMTGAWVHGVIGSPLSIENATPYKLASITQVVGAITDDRPSGISGLLGPAPHTFPVTVRLTTASGRSEVQRTRVADEEAIGLPTGVSALQQVLPLAVAQAAFDGLRGSPALQSGRMCIEIKLRGRGRPLGFCNRYVGGSPGSPGGMMPVDAGDAASTLAAYHFGPLEIEGVTVRMRVRTDSGIAYLRSVAVSPQRPRRGQMVTVRARAVVAGSGERIERTARVRIPRRAGRRLTVRVNGTPPDAGAGSALDDAVNVTLDDSGSSDAGSGPKTLAALAAAVAKRKRDDRARVRAGGGGVVRMALRGDDDVRLGGAAQVTVSVR